MGPHDDSIFFVYILLSFSGESRKKTSYFIGGLHEESQKKFCQIKYIIA